MAYTLPDLPYAYDALEPHIDARTMEIHHSKHHNTYITNLNKALEGAGITGPECVCDLVDDLSQVPESIRMAVRNNGGGHANHSFFWKLLSPEGGGEPTGALAEAINKTFGSFTDFQEKFKAEGYVDCEQGVPQDVENPRPRGVNRIGVFRGAVGTLFALL